MSFIDDVLHKGEGGSHQNLGMSSVTIESVICKENIGESEVVENLVKV